MKKSFLLMIGLIGSVSLCASEEANSSNATQAHATTTRNLLILAHAAQVASTSTLSTVVNNQDCKTGSGRKRVCKNWTEQEYRAGQCFNYDISHPKVDTLEIWGTNGQNKSYNYVIDHRQVLMEKRNLNPNRDFIAEQAGEDHSHFAQVMGLQS